MEWLLQNYTCFAEATASVRKESPVRSPMQYAAIEVRARKNVDCKFTAEYLHASNHGVRAALKAGGFLTNPDLRAVDEGFVLRTTAAPIPPESISMQTAVKCFLEINRDAHLEQIQKEETGFSLTFRFHE